MKFKLKRILKYKNFFLFILFLILWAILFSQIDLSALADKFSARGAYIVIFLVAFFGGVSVLTSSSYLATLVVLSLGPANPYLLALSAGTALTLGDSLFYFFGTRGRQSLPPSLAERLKHVADWLDDRSRTFVSFLVYVYTGFTPLPSDILMLLASFANYPLRKIIIPLYLGNITLVFVIYHLVQAGVDFAGA